MNPNEYWTANDSNRDQQFYAAFCILASACSDYATGISLKNENKLNWACTSLYYSLVHAARLICFVETGDFPTQHSELGELFTRGRRRVGSSWAKKRLVPVDNRVEPITDFCISFISPDNRLQWGKLLTEARQLRDDANYEGLLISHQFNHIRVTASFERLTTILKITSEHQIPKAVSVFKHYIETSPRREYWYAFLNWERGHDDLWRVPNSNLNGEGLYYLEASMQYMRSNHEVITTVLRWLSTLRQEPNLNANKAEEFHSNIVMSSFSLKSGLFTDFKTKIDELYSSFGNLVNE